MYREYSFLDRFAAAAADGFTDVEICFAYDVGRDVVASALRNNGQSLVSFNFPAGELIAGRKRGLAAIPGCEAVFMEQINEGLEWAAGLKIPHGIIPLAGMIAADADRAEYMETFVGNLKAASALAESAGVMLLVEPNNQIEHPNYFLYTMAQARDVVDAVASPSVKILFDTYHTQITEGRLTDTFIAHKDQIAHVQVGNPPGRNEPNHGEIDHKFLFSVMREEGYEGWIAGEYFAASGTTSGLDWMDQMGFQQ
jgi:hydroxypyruvate isomerase